jgi:hypothetical protein
MPGLRYASLHRGKNPHHHPGISFLIIPDNLGRIICRAVVGYDDFQVFKGFIENTVQALPDIGPVIIV